MKEQLFQPVIFRHVEYYVKFNSPQTPCFSTGDDASKGGTPLLDACSIDLHFVERVLVDEVKPRMSLCNFILVDTCWASKHRVL